MGTVTVEGIVREYLLLIEEGWTPDIEEFLHHVPEEMREETHQRILEVTAAPVEPEPEAPVEVDLFAPPEETGEVAEVVEAVDNPAPFEDEPEPEPEKPKLVKLTPEEAKAMFAEMEARTAASKQ